MRSEFEKAFPIPAHWIEFDEKANKYYCPYVADAKASEYQSMWKVWQHRQTEVDEQASEIKRLEYMLGDKGEHPQLKAYIDAEVHRRHEEKKASSNYNPLSKDDVDRIIKEVLDDCEQNPDKYQRNLYKQVDELQKRVDAVKQLIQEYHQHSYREADDFVFYLEQALKGGENE